MLSVTFALVSDPMFWLFLVVAIIIAAGLGCLAVYKFIPNNAKKQAETIMIHTEERYISLKQF